MRRSPLLILLALLVWPLDSRAQSCDPNDLISYPMRIIRNHGDPAIGGCPATSDTLVAYYRMHEPIASQVPPTETDPLPYLLMNSAGVDHWGRLGSLDIECGGPPPFNPFDPPQPESTVPPLVATPSPESYRTFRRGGPDCTDSTANLAYVPDDASNPDFDGLQSFTFMFWVMIEDDSVGTAIDYIETVEFFAHEPAVGKDRNGQVKNGFAIIELKGSTLEETFYDEDGIEVWPLTS